jgi:hypothetical protein
MGYADNAKAILNKLREETKKAPPDGNKPLFDERERDLLKNSPQEDLAGLANLKKAFPGSVIRVVESSPADEPISEAERKAQEMDAHLKDVCRRRNQAFADIEKYWPAVEKRRRQQKKEERNHEKNKNRKTSW